MKTHIDEASVNNQQEGRTGGIPWTCIGQIAGTTASGANAVIVGNGEPKAARLMNGLSKKELSQPAMRGREVLVAFDQGNPDRPIILGLLADPLDELIALDNPSEQKDVTLDGKRVTLEAQDEIVLKCGDGSITLRKDGKIIIKGTHLLSRSSGPNRIKGGSVQIN